MDWVAGIKLSRDTSGSWSLVLDALESDLPAGWKVDWVDGPEFWGDSSGNWEDVLDDCIDICDWGLLKPGGAEIEFDWGTLSSDDDICEGAVF